MLARRPCYLYSLLYCYIYFIFNIYLYISTLYFFSYKKTELVMMVCLPARNIGCPIYI